MFTVHRRLAECHKQSRVVSYNTRRQHWPRPVLSTSTDYCSLLITLDNQLCVQRNGRLGTRQRCAGPSVSAECLFTHVNIVDQHSPPTFECQCHVPVRFQYADGYRSKIANAIKGDNIPIKLSHGLNVIVLLNKSSKAFEKSASLLGG